MNRITFTVIEANKPSQEAIKRLNKAAYHLAAKTKSNSKKTA